jgi:hypothetical protein
VTTEPLPTFTGMNRSQSGLSRRMLVLGSLIAIFLIVLVVRLIWLGTAHETLEMERNALADPAAQTTHH